MHEIPASLQALVDSELPADASALLDDIGRRRGGLRAGGKVDRHKVGDVLMHEFRAGALGRISLERPDYG
jgi:ribosome biogenesis GTPase A